MQLMEKKLKVLYVVRLSHSPSFYFLFSLTVSTIFSAPIFGCCSVSVPPQGLIKFIYPCNFQLMHITTQTAIITAAKVVFELQF